MKEIQIKLYTSPQFQIVRHGESNVFFVASGSPEPKSVGASLSGIEDW